MSNVLIEKNKLDILATAISNKSGEPLKLTLDEMVEAVDGIETGGGEPNLQAKTYNVSSAGTATVTADSGYDGLSSVAVSVPSADPWLEIHSEYSGSGNNRVWTATPRVLVDVSEGDTAGFMADGYEKNGEDPLTIHAVPSGTTITPTESSQTIGGANYMMEGAVTVSAIPSNYVGSGVTQRSSSDLTARSKTVTAPAGYYASDASLSVANGSVGNPLATKGTVSDHTMTITPSVSTYAGWINNTTSTGTPITVSASELVSGTLSVTSAGTKDVTNYASASIPSGTEGTPTATKGTVSNHSVSVTPSVTNTNGFISGGTKTGTAVTVSASELVSGSETKTANGTYDVTNLAELVVDVSGGGGGASNIVTGTFTTGSSAGYTNISTGYTGSGYPIACMVFVEGGAYVSGTSWYTSTQRYAIGFWSMSKANQNTAPSYTTSGAQNQGVITAIYKNSTSSSTSYTRTSAMNTNVYSSNNASNSAVNTIKLKTNNTLSYYTNTSSYGLLPDTTYRYYIIYSS